VTSLEANEKVEFESGPLIVGSILVGVGGLLAFIGLVIGGLHAVNQAIRWFASLEHPPTDVAKGKWSQFLAAGAAGANAWKCSGPRTLTHPHNRRPRPPVGYPRQERNSRVVHARA
jgi:hypothetical protein